MSCHIEIETVCWECRREGYISTGIKRSDFSRSVFKLCVLKTAISSPVCLENSWGLARGRAVLSMFSSVRSRELDLVGNGSSLEMSSNSVCR